mgnify:CR=1 FL=1|tara:strand:+ start:12392 stop:13792 length:1401 start_codon:yes stop_codon:yes gene_type:complete
MSDFSDAYFRASKDIAGVGGALESAAFVNDVQSAIDAALAAMKIESDRLTNVGVNYVKGNLAEIWHAETLNVAAVAKGNEEVWAEALINCKTGQDVAYGNSSEAYMAELKYYGSAKDTAGALGNPAYVGNQKVVPSDQLEGVIAESQKQAARNQDIRPEVAAAYQDTADAVSDRIEIDGVTSKPLTEGDAKSIASELKRDGDINADKYGLNTEGFIEWSDIFRESGSAALNAAAFSAALTAAPHVYRIIDKCIKTGELDAKLIREGAVHVLSSSSAAGLRGGLAAVITGSCKSGLMGASLKGLSPTAIGMATAMALNSIENSWRYAQGQISAKELAFNSSRDAVALMMGGGGAALGQMLIPVPILGALLGNLVGSTIGAVGVSYANNKVLGICVESGWTFWGLVDQSYVVPEHVLREAGFDLFAPQYFKPELFAVNKFNVQRFQTDRSGFTFVRRGVIAFNAVGYQ